MTDNGKTGLAVIGAAVIGIIILNPHPPWSNEGVSYPAQCDPNVEVQHCQVRTLHRRYFRVDRADNEVVRWSEENAIAPALSKLHQCIIRDVRTWTCWYSDGSGPVVMVDGLEYHDPRLGMLSLRRWQWNVARWWSSLTGDALNLGWSIPAQPKP